MRGVHIRRPHLDLHAADFLEEGRELVGIGAVERHQAGHEFDRVIGLQKGGAVGDQRIGGGVRFVEAIAGKFSHQLEDIARLGPVDAARFGAFEETGLLLVHLLLFLLAHGAAQQIRLAERIARQDLGDLHHLFLIDDDAIGLLEHALEIGVETINFGAAEFAIDIDVDILHRAGTIERDQSDQILDQIGLHLLQRVAHAGGFQLEHADCVARGQKFECRAVIKLDPFEIGHIPAGGLDILQRAGDHRQGFQAEEVELHQTGRLDPFHVELGGGNIRARVAIKRHQLIERPVTDHDTGGVGRGVAEESLQFQSHFQQRRHGRVIALHFLQPWLEIERLAQRDRIGRIGRHHLGQPVDHTERHLQHPPDIAHHGARLQRTECDDLGDAVGAIALLHIADHLAAAFLAEIDIEIGHRYPFRIEEALEQEAEAQRVQICNRQ